MSQTFWKGIQQKYKIYKFLKDKSLAKHRPIKRELRVFLAFVEANAECINKDLLCKYKKSIKNKNGNPMRGLNDKGKGTDWRALLWKDIEKANYMKRSQDQDQVLEELLSFGSTIAKRQQADSKIMALAVFQLAQYRSFADVKNQEILKESQFQESQIVSIGIPKLLPPNRTFAMNVAQKLAKADHAGSIYVLGLESLTRGRAIVAVQHILKAAQLGNPQAQYHLATLYQTGVTGTDIKVDPIKAREWGLMAHEKDNIAGTFLLSQFYTTGYGSKDGLPDIEKAFELTKIVAEQGEPVAQHNLAQMYIDRFEQQLRNKETPLKTNGKFTNIIFAIEYYKMAAEQNFVPSIVALGMIFEAGYPPGNIDRKKMLAEAYYQRAIANYSRKEYESYNQLAKEGLSRLRKVL